MKLPEDLLYTATHEWVRNEGGNATVGITDYAQSQLKDVVYVEMPEKGSRFKKGDSLGVVESVKTVADLYSPITGKIVETNTGLKEHPQFVNEDPYGNGWIAVLDMSDSTEMNDLMSKSEYEKYLKEEEGK